MDNVFEELQKYIDKRVEEAVNERMAEFELQFMNPKKLTLKDFLIRLGVGSTKWGHGLECTEFAVKSQNQTRKATLFCSGRKWFF